MLPHHLDPAWWDSSDLVSLEVRLFSAAFMLFPLALLLVSLKKLAQLRRAHRAAQAAAASSPAATKALPSRQLAEFSATHSSAPVQVQAWQPPSSTLGRPSRLPHALTQPYAPADPPPTPDVHSSGRSAVLLLCRHKSLHLLLVSSLAGMLGTAWCLNNIAQGAGADMNTTFASPLLAVLYLGAMAYGRLKTQHQLINLAVSMMSKSGQVGRSSSQRRQDVRRFKFVLHAALGTTALMFVLCEVGIIMGMVDNMRLRRWSMLLLAVSVMLLTVCGAGSSFYIVARILATLKEHARALAMSASNKQQNSKMSGRQQVSGGSVTGGPGGQQQQHTSPRPSMLNPPASTHRLVSHGSSSPADDHTNVPLVTPSHTLAVTSAVPASRRPIPRALRSRRATVSGIIEVVVHSSDAHMQLPSGRASPTHTTPPIESSTRGALLSPLRSPSPAAHEGAAVQMVAIADPSTQQPQQSQQQSQSELQIPMPRTAGRHHKNPLRRRTEEIHTPSTLSTPTHVAAEVGETGSLARAPSPVPGELPAAPAASSSRRHIRYSSMPAALLPPRHGTHTGGAAGAPAAGSLATANSMLGPPSHSRRPSFSQQRADSTAIPIGVSSRPHSQGQQLSSHPAGAPDTRHLSPSVSHHTPSSHSEQMVIWQDKLSALKKSLVPIALTFGMAVCVLTVPWLSAHMTYTYPMCVVATNLALIVATKQLPTDF